VAGDLQVSVAISKFMQCSMGSQCRLKRRELSCRDV